MFMRSSAAVLVLSLCLFAPACQSSSGVADNAASPLEGTWELVSGVYTTAEGVVTKVDASEVRSMKVLNPTHFAFLTVSASDGKFIRAGGGPYRVEGTRYSETVRYASAPSMVNQTYEFSYRIDGDTWHHAGRLGRGQLEEVWRRVNQP